MKIAIDFHIHSGLSPCGDKDMTPNNIISMAKLKCLDAIAITDHNSTGNLASFWKVACENNLILIPGVEVTTREDVHILALFKELKDALNYQRILDESLPRLKNREQLFGPQLLYDEMDNVIGQYEYMLMNGLQLSIEDTVQGIRMNNGIALPAHINRDGFSILSSLGFISSELDFTTVEITKECDYVKLEKLHPYLHYYRKLVNSDAHHLGAILERESFIDVEEKTIESIFNTLGNPLGSKML